MSFLQPDGQVIDLGINIDQVAMLRNLRGTSYPDPLQAALMAEQAGADAIILRMRNAQDYITKGDLLELRRQILVGMNLQFCITPKLLDLACSSRPQEVSLISEDGEKLINAGNLDVVGKFGQVKAAIHQLTDAGIFVGVRIDPDISQIAAAVDTGAGMIELHTGWYAKAVSSHARQVELDRIRQCVLEGIKRGLKVHAGYGIDYTNVQMLAGLSGISRLNIGHAIVAQALFGGWQNAVHDMKAIMTSARLNAA